MSRESYAGRKTTSIRDGAASASSRGLDRGSRSSAPGRLLETMEAHPPPFHKAWSVAQRGRAPGELRDPTDVCFLPGQDRLIVADRANHRLQNFRGEAEAVELYDQKRNSCFKYPSSLALTTDQRYIVAADCDKLHFISLDLNEKGTCQKEWKPHISKKGDVKIIKSSAFDVDNNILITDFSAKPVVELYDHGTTKLVRTLAPTTDFRNPYYITCTKRNGLIYVSDNEQGSVHIFDKRSKHSTHLIGRSSQHKAGKWRLVSPHGMCVDDRGLVYVTDKAQNTVSLFMVDRLVQHVLTEAQAVKDPIAVSVSTDEKIAIASRTLDVRKDSYAVEVFKKMSLDH